MSTDLGDLEEPTRTRAQAAIQEMDEDEELKRLGMETTVVVETLRTLATQMAYFSRGRMVSIPDVQAMYDAVGLWKLTDVEARTRITWTLKSRHLSGHALDIAPQKDGKVWWNAPQTVWDRLGMIGEKYGFIWGGRWPERDLPHFEEPSV